MEEGCPPECEEQCFIRHLPLRHLAAHAAPAPRAALARRIIVFPAHGLIAD